MSRKKRRIITQETLEFPENSEKVEETKRKFKIYLCPLTEYESHIKAMEEADLDGYEYLDSTPIPQNNEIVMRFVLTNAI
jgi:hypothetical protein